MKNLCGQRNIWQQDGSFRGLWTRFFNAHVWKLMVYWVRGIICCLRHVTCFGIVSRGTFICRTG
jgi:hypothetical protein